MSNHRLEGMQNGNHNGHQNGHGRISGNGQQAAQRSNQQAGQAAALSREWATDPRWAGIERTYSAADVIRLRGSVQEEHTLARHRRGAAVVSCCIRSRTSTRSAR